MDEVGALQVGPQKAATYQPPEQLVEDQLRQRKKGEDKAEK